MIIKTLADGKKVNAYPLNNSQKMMFLASLKYGSGYPVNNIGCGYYWKGEMNAEIMKESVYEAVSRCDTMRLRFAADIKSTLLCSMLRKKASLLLKNGITAA